MGNAVVGNNISPIQQNTSVMSSIQVGNKRTTGQNSTKDTERKDARQKENLENDRFSRLVKHRLPIMLEEIEKEEELSDEHIDHAQALLRSYFKKIGGFLSISALTATQSGNLISPKSKFIQIFHIPEREHWICVSNHMCDGNQLVIYDSLLKKKPIASFELQEKLAALLHSESDIMLEWVDMKRQLNYVDCGVYAIAAATALCHNSSPERCDWDPSKMRSHLMDCFKNSKITPFPTIGEVRHPGRTISGSIKIYCFCHLPISPKEKGLMMCSKCSLHYHRKCVLKQCAIDKEFVCKTCVFDNSNFTRSR